MLNTGFATNWCILGHDYAIRDKRSLGYNTILLRDAATGIEYPDTLKTQFATELSIREAEQQYGFLASNEGFFVAVRGV